MAIKNFPLQDIELHIEDQLIEQAEQLLAASKLEKLLKPQPSLWAATFDGVEKVETEIQLGRNNVKAYSCDCDIFSSEGICSHIAATLLSLRLQRNQEKEAKPKSSHTQSYISKLSTVNLLKAIPADELKAFVKDFARDNRSFALALKARFAHQLILHDEGEQYQLAINSILNNIRRPGTRLSKSGLKQITQLVSQLYQQTETAAHEFNFQKAFIILKAVLDQVTAALILQVKLTADLKSNISSSIQMADYLLEQDLAPQFRQRILKFLLEIIFRPFYLQHGFFESGAEVIIRHVTDGTIKQQLNQKLNDQLAAEENNESGFLSLLILRAELLIRDQVTDLQFEKIIGTHLHQPNLLLKSIHRTAERKKWRVLQFLATFGLSRSLPDASRFILKMAMLRAATETKDKVAIKNWALECLLHSLHPDYYHNLKQAYRSQWKSQLRKVLKEIESLPDTTEKENLLATIFTEEQEWEKLGSFIRKSQKLSLLTRFDDQFGKAEAEALKQLYKDMLADYLSNHLGRQAALKVRNIMAHLHKTGHPDWARQFIHQIRKNYSERHSLMEELDIF